LRRHSLALRTLATYMAIYTIADLSLGCSTTHVDSTRHSGGTLASTASLSVAIYDTVAAEHKRQPVAGLVATRLLRDSGGALEVIGEFASSTWSLDTLPPGRYRLHVLPATPVGASTPQPIEKERFTLKAGQQTTIVVILEDRRGAYWTAMGVGVAAVVVAVVAALISSVSHTSCTTKSVANKAPALESEQPNPSLQRTRYARR
jgi:hypothetical protein